jgi:hypothetical protein
MRVIFLNLTFVFPDRFHDQQIVFYSCFLTRKRKTTNKYSAQVNIAVAKVWFVEITDGLIQAVMYCGQDKNKKTIMISDVSLAEVLFYIILS